MADKLEISGQLEWIRADRLTIDPRYQRKLNESKVRRIVREFDPDAFGVLYCSRRSRTEIVVLDGQQRLNAVLRMEWGDQLVPTVAYEGLTVSDEAALFVQYNDVRTKPRPMELHRARREAGDKRAVTLDRVVEKRGLRIVEGNLPGAIQAVQSLGQVYDGGGVKVLERTIDILLHAYGAQAETFHGELLTAVGVIVARHGHILDDGRLARTLTKMPITGLLRKARVMKAELDVAGGASNRVATVVAGIVLKAYNLRLSQERRIYFDLDQTGKAYWSVDDKG